MSKPILLSTTDPALHSSHLEREFQDMHGNKVSVMRSSSNHFVLLDDQPVLYSENFSTRLWRLARIPQQAMDECVNLLKKLSTDLPSGKTFEILEINAKPAANCKLAEVFLQNGFERVGDKLVL